MKEENVLTVAPTSQSVSEIKDHNLYARKPLTFILPALKTSQAEKNPFKRKQFLKLRTTTTIGITKTASDCSFESKPLITKAHSFTPTEQKRTKITLEKVPKPSLFVSEPLEGDTACDEFSPLEEQKSKIKEEDPAYEITLNKEVMYYFNELEKGWFLSMEDVSKKFVSLPEVKGKKSNKTLLLDLDDTLVHTLDPNLNYSVVNIDKANIKNVTYADPVLSSIVNIKVAIRPDAVRFLKEISPYFEIIVFF